MSVLNDKLRLEEIRTFNVLDTPADPELDQLNELASIICDTQISLISIIDNHRQWYKSKKGLEISEIPVEQSFCKYTLDRPNSILEIPDATQDNRFAENAFVTSDPGIRFYASIPLVTKRNQVIGTLCVADYQTKALNPSQKKALSLLASMAMDKLELKRIVKSQSSAINFNTKRLVKITENTPSAIFEMALVDQEIEKFIFMSKSIGNLYPEIEFKEWLSQSKQTLKRVMGKAFNSLKKEINNYQKQKDPDIIRVDFQYQGEKDAVWHSLQGKIDLVAENKVVMYGSIIDVSKHYELQAAIDQVLFDISHVIRRPVTTLQGIVELIEEEEQDKRLKLESLSEYARAIKVITEELDQYTKNLNLHYQRKKEEIFQN